jgi:glycosyltransferase involved in cell wall biosynthesis
MIVWKSATVSPSRASFRYRVAIPALNLERFGVKSSFRWHAGTVRLDDDTEALILAKTFSIDDLRLARRAHAKSIPIVLDLCDNIFVEGFPPEARVVFGQLSRFASVIVTTNEAMAEVIRQSTPHAARMLVIPDAAETREDAERIVVRFSKLEFQERVLLLLLQRVAPMATRWINAARRLVRNPAALFDVSNHVKRYRWLAGRDMAASGPWPRLRPAVAPAPKQGPVTSETSPAAPTAIITWFGNQGGEYSDFGMRSLLLIAPELERVNRERPLRLRVVSNSRAKYEELIRPLPVASEYIEWHPLGLFEHLKDSAVVVLPNPRDSFTRCKSSNRALLALSCGVPVVATRQPALEPLRDCLLFDDWEASIHAYLTDAGLRKRHLSRAAEVVGSTFHPDKIGEQWKKLLQELASGRRASQPAVPQQGRPQVIFVVDLVQDLELILPLYRLATQARDLDARLWATTNHVMKYRHVTRRLERERLDFELVDILNMNRGGLPRVDSVRALVCASESSLPPHHHTHALVQWANKRGIATYTMQHGFENVGLTYSDEEYPVSSVSFASQRIFMWGPLDTLLEQVPRKTREKCLPVGCPKPLGSSGVLPDGSGRPVISVFENLHWMRYTDAYRDAFLDDFVCTASAFPNLLFVIKPHPAGLWLTHRRQESSTFPENVVVANVRDPEWSSVTADDLLTSSAAVITSPSTIALDAARLGKPVAVVGYALDLSAYEPLFAIRSRQDWTGFVSTATADRGGTADLAERSRSFSERVVVPGDAAGRILNHITAAIRPAQKRALSQEPRASC